MKSLSFSDQPLDFHRSSLVAWFMPKAAVTPVSTAFSLTIVILAFIAYSETTS